MSFLNIGSGSGYISHIVAAILGSGSINHGVELHQELVEFASSRCSVCPALRHINYISFMQGDAFQLDPGHRRYDRVYVGAGSMAQYSAVLHELIAVGGVMVVPQGNHLLCVRRESDGTFSSSSVANVHFKSLEMPNIRNVRDMPKVHVPCGQVIPSEKSIDYTATARVEGSNIESGIVGVTQSTATLS